MLQLLNLSCNPSIDNEGARRLAEAMRDGALQQCTTLNLAFCSIGDAGIYSLVSAIDETQGSLQVCMHAICLISPSHLAHTSTTSHRAGAAVPQAGFAHPRRPALHAGAFERHQ